MPAAHKIDGLMIYGSPNLGVIRAGDGRMAKFVVELQPSFWLPSTATQMDWHATLLGGSFLYFYMPQACRL